MVTVRTRVVKIGGSLLELPDLAARFHRWHSARDDCHDVCLVGGGAAVDELRGHALDDVTAHWAAIDIMHRNALQLATELDIPVTTFDRLPRVPQPGATMLDVVNFMREVEPRCSGTRLPATWDVTSDAIAGRMAVVLGANELVLLKSRPASHKTDDLESLATDGLIDAFLPILRDEVPAVTFVDTRNQDSSQHSLAQRQPLVARR